jgi:hypothetical protein
LEVFLKDLIERWDPFFCLPETGPDRTGWARRVVVKNGNEWQVAGCSALILGWGRVFFPEVTSIPGNPGRAEPASLWLSASRGKTKAGNLVKSIYPD